MTDERVRQVVEYLEQDDTDPESLVGMGLTSADLSQVLAAVPERLRGPIETLYETRRQDEERAGLAIPIVVVKPDTSMRRKLIIVAVLSAVSALGAAAGIRWFVG